MNQDQSMDIDQIPAAHNGKPLSTADRIMNSVLYGDPRGFGYAHPTPKEAFEDSKNLSACCSYPIVEGRCSKCKEGAE
jgi:hypothetical protein